MNDIQLTFRELYLYVFIVGVVLGVIFGLIPLLLGRRRNKARLGLYGFIASIIGGAIAPLLAIIVPAIFAWVITRNGSVQTDGVSGSATSSAADPGTDQ